MPRLKQKLSDLLSTFDIVEKEGGDLGELELVHCPCGYRIFDVEATDTLEILVRGALSHDCGEYE